MPIQPYYSKANTATCHMQFCVPDERRLRPYLDWMNSLRSMTISSVVVQDLGGATKRLD